MAHRVSRLRLFVRRLARAALALGLLAVLSAAAGLGYTWWHYGRDLPDVQALTEYTPATVTVITDRDGALLGELYEKRRYVLPQADLFPLRTPSSSATEQCRSACTSASAGQCGCAVPRHVIDAFVAAEDARFWEHWGIDLPGIARAAYQNTVQGRKAQGASTITQQVARNFLLTSDKTYERKIREILLAYRIERAFSKEHILYLYLNEIYLGSGAYGIEAASQVYFGQPAYQLSLAEAALLAGLPRRPSETSPHRDAAAARSRQQYVLDQMHDKGLIGPLDHARALDEVVEVEPLGAPTTQAPYFTEHIRRYLVDTYGFDKVYNDGLIVQASCDLALQQAAQRAVFDNVEIADQRRGWRGVTQKLTQPEIAPWLFAQEQTMLAEASRLRVGPVAPTRLPTRSTLRTGDRHAAVVLWVDRDEAEVGIGAHQRTVRIRETSWAYPPDPDKRWKKRKQTDLREVLAAGDVVTVVLDEDRVSARLAQPVALQGALLSYRLSDGAVLAMVGGIDFDDSEYNRATQARRQVGSTFKPIVYAAAIGSRRFSVSTPIDDTPLAFDLAGGTQWRPQNYGGGYMGRIPLQLALQRSRNVATIRLLERVGLQRVYKLAGPALRIGYNAPACSRTHIPTESYCAGERSASPIEGMSWCEHCAPRSCPVVETGSRAPGDPKTCADAPFSADGRLWCRSCDVNLRVCDWLPESSLPSGHLCLDARRTDDGRVWCRSCDLSIALGSSSLTMVELSRAYSAFATYGSLVEPYFIEQVLDRDGRVIEAHTPSAPEAVMEPGVAAITHWMLRGVATAGTAAQSNRLGIHLAGKTGTTNDFYDAWFVGYTPDVITATWVGFDAPRKMGQSFTGGNTALPMWMDYMSVAAPQEGDRPFPPLPGVRQARHSPAAEWRWMPRLDPRAN